MTDSPTTKAQPDLCQVCSVIVAKYKCPGCRIKTCSKDCIKVHKDSSECSGKRNITGYLGRGQLDEQSLLSDFRFLEHVQAVEYAAKRSRPAAPRPVLPPPLQSLVHQAEIRGIQLHILPPGMQKRKRNSTHWDKKNKSLRWHVEWHFTAANDSCRVSNAFVPENTILKDLLAKHLTLEPGTTVRQPAMRQYINAGTSGVSVKLKKEKMPANVPSYFDIDLNNTITEALEGKNIVEYPTFLVGLKRPENLQP